MILSTQLINKNWMPVTGYSGSALTTADAFKGTFGVLSGISTDALTYTAVTSPAQEGSTDAYTTTGLVGTDTTTAYGIYYHFELDYMITATKSLKVTATATPSVETTPSIAQATRVGIIAAKSVTINETSKQMTGATYNDAGKEYTVAAPATGTDYNLEELKALGYEGDSEYKDNLTRLDEAGATFSPTETTTSDEAFAYGSLSIYVWFDGTDYSCTNAIFSQTLDYLSNKIEDDKTGNVIKK